MKIYIAGKITGMEKKAEKLFEKAELSIKNSGHEPVNPMKLPHKHDKTYVSYLKECLQALLTCEAIYLLDNWEQSEGAKFEYEVAKKLYFTKFHQL